MFLTVHFFSEINLLPFPGTSKPPSSRSPYLHAMEWSLNQGRKSWAVIWVLDACLSPETKVSWPQHWFRPAGLSAWPVDILEVFSSVWGLQKSALGFPKNSHPSSTPPFQLGPQEYFEGNSIHMCLIRVHLTHWHVVFQELIDVQGVFWPFFLNLAELPFFELENCLSLG